MEMAAWALPESWRPPKHDLAAKIARAVFENNWEALYKAYTKAALRGNGYVFKKLADRGYGRLKERIELDRGPYTDLSDEQLQRQITELEKKLGVPPQQPTVLAYGRGWRHYSARVTSVLEFARGQRDRLRHLLMFGSLQQGACGDLREPT